MSLYTVLSIVIALAAVFSYVNYRFFKLPPTIGVTVIALTLSVALIVSGRLGLQAQGTIAFVRRIDFPSLVLEGMLSLLLFAGSLAVDPEALAGQKLSVTVLATVGVLVSTAFVGAVTWWLARATGLSLSLPESLLFGAIVSPTDPIAVIGVLRAAGAPKSLDALMAGEALFNDGVAIALFAVLLPLAASPAVGGLDMSSVGLVFAREIVGSIALGVALGWVVLRLLRSVDDYQLEVLLTLGLALGLYSLAAALNTSGPLAVVVAGLLVGSRGRSEAMSASTQHHLDVFWMLVDEILNVLLFVLVGFELLVVPVTGVLLVVGAAALVLVIVVRAIAVAATVAALARLETFPPHSVKILTWGGLRGGLSIAMALSLGPRVASRHALQAITYVVAVGSIALQGLTFGPLVRATKGGPTKG
ncbi:MAG TPA: sodium:proton antiporter [Polyangia bacterium]|nr:sodium:proton antiporter [Polyangia bacterium]